MFSWEELLLIVECPGAELLIVVFLVPSSRSVAVEPESARRLAFHVDRLDVEMA